VQVVSIQSQAVDGIFRSRICLVCTGSRGGYVVTVDGISKQLGRKTPDIAYPRTVGVDVIDLIDAPVVNRVEIKALGKSIAGGTLGDSANAVVDVVEALTKAKFVPIDWGRVNSRRPAKDHIPENICCPISRARIHCHRRIKIIRKCYVVKLDSDKLTCGRAILIEGQIE